MSYDLRLKDAATGNVIEIDEPHHLRGGTYQSGGTRELELNITYNYWPHYRRLFGENDIRTLYGMTARDSLTVLAKAISELGTDEDPDYWKATEGNARIALVNLLILATMAPPDAVWDGD